MVKAKAEIVKTSTFGVQQLEDSCLNRMQVGESHKALGGARLVGDPHEAPAGRGKPTQSSGSARDEAYIIDAQRRFRAPAHRVGNELVDDTVAVDEHGGAVGAHRRSASAGRRSRASRGAA